MPLSCKSCCHSLGSPVNSPVDVLKPTCVRWTGSYGVLISGCFELFRKSDMKVNIPFLDLVVVLLRDRLPAALIVEGVLGARDLWRSVVEVDHVVVVRGLVVAFV